MAVHLSRRRGPLPTDIEFTSLDSFSSGWSLVESALLPTSTTSHRSKGDLEIVPLVKLGLIQGLDGPNGTTYGPFNPPQKCRVPVWLAVHLKKKRKCRIVVPKWLSLQYLEEILKEEQTSAEFSDLPRDYLELSKVLLDVASDDLNEPERLRLVLKDIREARQAKVREGLGAVNSVHLGMPNLSTLELTELKPFFSQSFERLALLDPESEALHELEMDWMKDPEGVFERLRRGEIGEEARRRRDESEFGGGRGY